jgi:hypothetical protein
MVKSYKEQNLHRLFSQIRTDFYFEFFNICEERKLL